MFTRYVRMFLALIGAGVFGLAAPAAAQSVYGTAAGTGVKVAGVVPLQCNASGAACAPVTASNPAGPNQVVGNVASGATDSGNPVKMGGQASANGYSVSVGQRVDAWLSPKGAFIIGGTAGGAGADGLCCTNYFTAADGGSAGLMPIANSVYNGSSWDRLRGDTNGAVVQPALSSTFWNYAAATGGIASSTADVAVKAAGGAGVRNYVCGIDLAHDTLGAVSEIVIKDGATVLWRTKLQTTAIDGAAGAGKILFSPCLRGTANTAVNVAMLTSTTGGVFVNVSGYTGS